MSDLSFRNPSNGYIEVSENVAVYGFIFGSFYFLYKRAWAPAIIWIGGLTLATPLWLIMPWWMGILTTIGLAFIQAWQAPAAVQSAYLRRGWQEVKPREEVSPLPLGEVPEWLRNQQ